MPLKNVAISLPVFLAVSLNSGRSFPGARMAHFPPIAQRRIGGCPRRGIPL